MRWSGPHYVKALYDFQAQTSTELSLQAGDVVLVTDNVDADWLLGETLYGSSGTFPANYVDEISLPDVRMDQRLFVALVDFLAERNGDLYLAKGDIILGLEPVDDNWWKGKNGPLRGIFPLSCVHELIIPTEGPRARSSSLQSKSSSLKARSDSLATETLFARALVDVVPQIEDELGFQTGDLITVKEIMSEDWFYGECHNKVGLVSTICVEFLDDLGDTSVLAPDQASMGKGTQLLDAGHQDFISKEVSLSDEVDRVLSIYDKSISQERFSQREVNKEVAYQNKNLLAQNVSYTSENTRSHDAEITPYARTIYPFQAELPSEISFSENEIVTLIQHVNEDWIEGELDGKIGLFPAGFVEIIVDCPYAYDKSTSSLCHEFKTTLSFTENSSESKICTDTVANNTSLPEGRVKADLDLNKTGDVVSGASVVGQNRGVLQSSGSLPSSSEFSSTCKQRSTLVSSIRSITAESIFALVLHDFTGQVEGDLTIKEGETVEVLHIIDDHWLEARNECGDCGLVPKNHLEIISGGPGFSSVSSKEQIRVESSPASEDRSFHADIHRKALDSTVREVASQEIDKTQVLADSPPQCKGLSAHNESEDKSHVQSLIYAPTTAIQGTSTISVFCQSVSGLTDSQERESAPPASSKPTLKPQIPTKPKVQPKPKLAPKPAVKPKPALAPKPIVGMQNRAMEVVHETNDTEIETNVSINISAKMSLNNHAQAEISKVKSEGERSGSKDCAEKNMQLNGSSDSSSLSGYAIDKIFSLTVSGDSHIAGNEERIQIHKENIANKGESLSSSTGNLDRYAASKPHESLYPRTRLSLNLSESQPSVLHGSKMKRSNSDNRLSDAALNPASLQMSPSFPIPLQAATTKFPPGAVKQADKEVSGSSFVNQGYECEGEGRLIGLEAENSRPLPPSRPVPLPPSSAVITFDSIISRDASTLSDSQRRAKRPPPRPSGPRVAAVPSKIPLQPVKVGVGMKPVPHRPAPQAPVLSATPRPSSSSLGVPPRPLGKNILITPPPKRPPPLAPGAKSPSDLMRFSPEPSSDDESNAEVVADLKKRIYENDVDIKKYEQEQLELEAKLSEVDTGKNDDNHTSLEFVKETLKGLREEEKRLKGNLFHVSPLEERLEKARLLAQQRKEEERLRSQENKKQQEEQRAKRRDTRESVLQELIETEKNYLFCLQLCITTFYESSSSMKVPESVDLEFLFGNMEEIADVSQRLFTQLESAVIGKEFEEQVVGTAFVDMAEDMKNTYAPYCRNHDDVLMVMEKHKDNPEVCEYFAAKVEEMRQKTNIFDVEAMLIKPVQRILKYPLLLNELQKCTEDDHADKTAIRRAIEAMTNVATSINEYKRRKDLVYKYKKETDETFTMKIAKLNLHSIKKKSTRMRGRLSTNLGIALQLRDEQFEKEDNRFRNAEKAVKALLRSVMNYLERMREVFTCQDNLAEGILCYYGDAVCEEIARYMKVHQAMKAHRKILLDTIEELVITPLNKLVALLDGPNKIIQKRFDKLLDYNNLIGRGKEDKVVQAAKNDYEAMNAQLLDELPQLYELSLTLIRCCSAAFVRAQRDFWDRGLKENCILLELPSILGANKNIMESFNMQHAAAFDHVSSMSFIPRGFNPRIDALRFDRKGSVRPPADAARPSLTVQSNSQSASQREYLRQTYGVDRLYQVAQTIPASDVMDMAVSQGTLLAVIKDKDPMGGRQRWFVDDGVNKGFVQSSILTKVAPSLSGSTSDLTSDDTSDTTSIYSASMDDMDSSFFEGQQQYPEVTTIESGDALPSYYDTHILPEHYYAEFPFTARSENEASLVSGQEVVVLAKHDITGNTEWWLVDANGHQGYAPATYLRKVV